MQLIEYKLKAKRKTLLIDIMDGSFDEKLIKTEFRNFISF